MMLNAIILMIAGLGLFFVGVKGLGANMSQLMGRSLRQWLSRSTGNYLLYALGGLLSGAVTQSTKAVTVILMSLSSVNLIPLSSAKPILAWANVGTAALVFLATIDMHLVVYALVGATGFCFYLNLDRSARWRPLVSAVLAVGLLLLGIEFIHDGSNKFANLGWLRGVFLDTAHWSLLTFLAGIALALIVQSSATVTVIAIALISAHLLTLGQAILTVYGASVGSGISTYLVSANIRGASGQLAIFQVVIKVLSVVILVPLYFLERSFGIPLVIAFVQRLAADPARQIAFVYLVCNLVAVAAEAAMGPALLRLLEKLSPPLAQEGLAKPRYIYPEAISDPETALTLVDREQVRLFALVPLYFGITESLGDEATLLDRAEVLLCARELGRFINEFLKDLADTGAERRVIEAIADRQARSALLASIHDSLASLAENLSQPFDSPVLKALGDGLREGLGALLETSAEAVGSLDPTTLELMRQLTSDRDSVVVRLRESVLAADQGVSASDHKELYAITSLFELIVWMLRRYNALLAPRVMRMEMSHLTAPQAAHAPAPP
ncbi:MAG TPA: Na/Pi symporter [Acetobacteraceae bacterium]|nr:Na/Pi symporter [Acetobacteraceae bacterium]